MRVLAFLLSVLFASTAEAQLRAGVARVDITPSALMQMYGYANRRCGDAKGTHDPLMAKALVLDAGGSQMAIVTMDLGSMVSENLRRDVASRLNIPVLLLSASHSHSAPSFLPFGSSPTNDPNAPAYLAELERKVFGAIEEASKAMTPVTLQVGRGSLQLGYNRLLPRDDGRTRALFENPERTPYGPVDPEFVLLRLDGTDGQPRALLVHYATHAVVLGPTNCQYSADYPGAMQAKVESTLPGTQVMFVQGGAGDINPLMMARSGQEDADFVVVKKMGDLLADAVIRVNKTVQIPSKTTGILSKSEILKIADRWDPAQTLDVGITTVLINGAIAIAAVPGEAMHKLQRMWKEQAEVPVPLFFGYTFSSGGTWAGYIPDLRSAAHGGYGADVTTRVEIGAGERIVQRHLINLYGLLGMWLDKPGLQ
jgi:neutral/alkaline ceramidase-like enzyme